MTARKTAVVEPESAITGTHPYAEKFPMLPEEELEALAESIRENGLRSPVVLTPDGLILDGRNRAAACELAGIEPETVVYEGDDYAEYVLDCNVTRRNMSTGARAMATALVLEADGRRGDGRWKRGTVTQDSILSSGWLAAVRDAGIVLDFKPDLAPAVAAGDLALDAAFQQAKAVKESADADKIREREERRRAKADAEAEATQHREIIEKLAGTKYEALILDGTLNPSSAWAAYSQDTRKEREREAEERKNDIEHIRAICRSLGTLAPLEHPKMRAWALRAERDHSEAVSEIYRVYHTPEAIEQIIGWLTIYAEELRKEHHDDA